MATETEENRVGVASHAHSTFDDIRMRVESICNAESAFVPIEVGSSIRQGDLYLTAIDVRLVGKPAGSRQLAPGTTQGSRHVVEGTCHVLSVDEDQAIAVLNRLIPASRGQRQFVGPLIVADGPVTIAHPEHGWRILPPGNYLVTYQRSYFAEMVRRQLD